MALVKSKDLIDDSVRMLHKFQSGEIQPLKTGIDHLDRKLLGGLRPSDVVGICALPFHGKTYLEERISSHMEEENGEEVIFVKCLWELEMFKKVIRELSKGSNKSVDEVINEMPDEETKALYGRLLDKYRKDNIYVQGEPVGVNEFITDIKEAIEAHPDKKIVVTIDNLENALLEGRPQKEVMDSIIQAINKLKKQHPYIVFIVLNQLNRELQDRTDNPKNHFPIERDIYGSGALFKIADVVLVLNMPFRMNINDRYGVFPKNRYQYIDDSFKCSTKGKTMSFDPRGKLFYHYLKYRNVEETYDIDDIYIEQIFETPEPTSQEEDDRTGFDF